MTWIDALNQLPHFPRRGNARRAARVPAVMPRSICMASARTAISCFSTVADCRVPTFSGDVDVNFIPDSILSGVDTITGGASAVYGSDAMSGVVNFTDGADFEGIAPTSNTATR